MRLLLPAILALLASSLTGCATKPAPAPTRAAASSILQSSDPAAGAIVTAPVNALILNFSPPARLGELTVAGPHGTMPMMITAAGEQTRYSVPLPALGPGTYTVTWQAIAGGQESRGSFAFTVK